MKRIIATFGIGALAVAAACADTATVVAPEDASFNRGRATICPALGTLAPAAGEPSYDITGTIAYYDSWVPENPTGDLIGTVKIDLTQNVSQVVVTAPSGYVFDGACAKGGTTTGTAEDGAIQVIDGGVTAIITMASGKDVSHFSVRFKRLDVPDGAEWCSPGFWRNNYDKHGASAWPQPAEDYANTLYSLLPLSIEGIDKPPLKSGGDATAIQILRAPQTYGGPAFNYVATWLSDLTDLNVTNPIVHNCPFNQQGERE